jgi:pyridoxal phosphate enzyme (YggS family)
MDPTPTPRQLERVIALQVAAVRAEIATACQRVGRDPAGVRLIAVTKSQGPEVLAPLAAAGIRDVGENRLEHQELMFRAAAGLGLDFHAIGRVQGRQLAKLVPLSTALHSLAEPDHVARLGRACAGGVRKLQVFLQVNTSGEAAKAGISPEALPDLVRAARAEDGLDVVGLMTMAPEGADDGVIRATFAALRRLAQTQGLPRLSMGMSQDFSIAVEEGATEVRIGTRLFTEPG